MAVTVAGTVAVAVAVAVAVTVTVPVTVPVFWSRNLPLVTCHPPAARQACYLSLKWGGRRS
ncbi:MAG: hypothetical protein ACKPAD_14110, partial [Bacteroidota bacterium]